MGFSPRSYQQRFLTAMETKNRAALVWHRRAGKDLTTINFTAQKMRARIGVYYYFLPTYTQAKKIVWDGIDARGNKFIDNFPKSLIAAKHETELKITYKTGSVFQLIGGDNIDTIVGTNPVGIVLSEYALMNPRAWELTQPILMENGGWAVFDYTPRGKNHGHRLWIDAVNNPDVWFSSMETVDTTKRDGPEDFGYPGYGGPVVTPEQINEARRSGMSEEMIQQEFYCSFEGAMVGAYYADQLAQLMAQGRILNVPYDPMIPVDTAWDLGLDDAMAIWFTQTDGGLCRVIDYMEAHTHGLDWYARELRTKGYHYGRHYGPHDIKARELSSGNSRIQLAAKMGLHFEAQPKLAVEDGIAAGRRLLPLCVFDGARCEKGLDALKSYRREWDEKTQTWKPTPLHDWSSHGADAFRTRAIAWVGGLNDGRQLSWADTRYDVMKNPSEQTQAEYKPGRMWSRSGQQVQATIRHSDEWWGDRD